MSQNQNPSNFVDENRLWQNQMLLAQIGATPVGVNRQALSSEEIEARKLLLSWSERLRLTTFVDQIGNLFFSSQRYCEPVGACNDWITHR